jgi:hypothetical protein
MTTRWNPIRAFIDPGDRGVAHHPLDREVRAGVIQGRRRGSVVGEPWMPSLGSWGPTVTSAVILVHHECRNPAGALVRVHHHHHHVPSELAAVGDLKLGAVEHCAPVCFTDATITRLPRVISPLAERSEVAPPAPASRRARSGLRHECR